MIDGLLGNETALDEDFEPVYGFVDFFLDGTHLRNEICLRFGATRMPIVGPDAGAALDELPGDLCGNDICRKTSDQSDHVKTEPLGTSLKLLLVHERRLSNRRATRNLEEKCVVAIVRP